MASPKRICVDDRTGDGAVLSILPEQLRRKLRPLAMRSQSAKDKRLVRVARRIYPALQHMEEMAVGSSQRLLANRGFDEACKDSRCIERALTLFEVAWQTGLTELLPSAAGAALTWGNTRATLGACGLSVAQTQQHFMKLAVKAIFQNDPPAFERLQGFIDEKTSLARMRLLAGIDALSIAELQAGWGRRFSELLTTKDDHFAAAVRRLKPFQVRSMRQVMGSAFAGVLDWPAEMVDAVGESFQCVEQFRDMGEFFALLTSPEAVRAVGRWERRDVTDAVNEDRKKKGKKAVKGRRWETDIALIKRYLGTTFSTLLERDPGVIDLFGEIFGSRIRDLEEPAKTQALEGFMLLSKRYLAYLTGDMLMALMHPQEGEVLSFAEIIAILEGLWMKNGLGTGFFESTFQIGEGVGAVRGIATDFVDMKRRGSAKAGTDIAALIRDSDLFDRHIIPLMRKKSKTGG